MNNYDTIEKKLTLQRQNDLSGLGEFHFSESWKKEKDFYTILRKWRNKAKILIPKTYEFNDVSKEAIVDIIWDRLVKYFDPEKTLSEFTFLTVKNIRGITVVEQACINYQKKHGTSNLSLDTNAAVNTTGKMSAKNKRFNDWEDKTDKDLSEHIRITGLMSVKGDRNPETDQESLHFRLIGKRGSEESVVEDLFNRFTLDVSDGDKIIKDYNNKIKLTILKFDIITGEYPDGRFFFEEFERQDKLDNSIEFGMLQKIRALTIL